MKHLSKKALLGMAIHSILFTGCLVTTTASADDAVELLTFDTINVELNKDTAVDSSSATGIALDKQHTPQSVSTITKKDIKQQQLSNISTIAQVVPNISMQRYDGGRTKFYARGFEIDNINVDGMQVSYGSTWGEGTEFGSSAIYDQVDVVKGANGLSSGSGNPSASINLVRKRADSSDFTGEISTALDNFGMQTVTLDASSRLNPTGSLRGRTILDYADGGVYSENEEKTRKTAYAVVDADITDATTVSIGGMHQENLQKSIMNGGLPLFYNDYTLIDWDSTRSIGTDWTKRDGISDEVFASIDHDINDNWNVSVTANHVKTEGDSKLLYIKGLVDKNTDTLIAGKNDWGNNTASNSIWQTDSEDTNVKAELTGTFDAFGQEHKVMLGADYNDYDTKATQISAQPTTAIKGVVNGSSNSIAEPEWDYSKKTVYHKQNIKENSVYGAVHLQVAEPLGVSIGSRISNFSSDGFISTPFGPASLDGKKKNVWTPFLGLTYDAHKNVTLFASYTDIFQPQKEKNTKGELLDPITGKNLEVGIKGSFNNDKLQTQLSVFKIEQDNLAQRDGDKVVEGTFFPAHYGAEGATNKGVELEVTGQVAQNWNLSAGFTKYTSKDANNNVLDTKRPKTLAKVFATYDASKFVPNLTLGAGVNWNDGYYVDLSGIPQIDRVGQGDVTLVNLMANYKINDNFDLQFNVNNALNQKHASFDFDQVVYGAPTTASGKLTFKW